MYTHGQTFKRKGIVCKGILILNQWPGNYRISGHELLTFFTKILPFISAGYGHYKRENLFFNRDDARSFYFMPDGVSSL